MSSSERWIEKGPRLTAALFSCVDGEGRSTPYCSGLVKRCALVVHSRLRSGGSGAREPVFFDIEKHHGIGDDSDGILMAAEIDLALDALPGGHIKGEIFR
jgi:hypothetical protein